MTRTDWHILWISIVACIVLAIGITQGHAATDPFIHKMSVSLPPPKVPPHPSADFVRGWCAGYAQAVLSVRQNRDNWRRLINAPLLTDEQVMQAIYAPNARGPSLIDSVDLYVLLPNLTGPIVFQGGPSIDCGNGEK